MFLAWLLRGPGSVQSGLIRALQLLAQEQESGQAWGVTVPSLLLENLSRGAKRSDMLLSRPAPGTFFSFPVHIYVFPIPCLYFLQKSLPQLEKQIKEKQQKVTEDLQKCGMDVPEEESEKMVFLIEVSLARCITLESHAWNV